MQTALSPWSSARDRKKVSIGVRIPPGALGSVRWRTPALMSMSLPGGMTYTWFGSTRIRSSTWLVFISVSLARSSAMKLWCLGSRWRTATKAIPLSGGVARRNLRSASRPPAEAPIPTTGTPSVAAAGAARARWGRRRAGARATARRRGFPPRCFELETRRFGFFFAIGTPRVRRMNSQEERFVARPALRRAGLPADAGRLGLGCRPRHGSRGLRARAWRDARPSQKGAYRIRAHAARGATGRVNREGRLRQCPAEIGFTPSRCARRSRDRRGGRARSEARARSRRRRRRRASRLASR